MYPTDTVPCWINVSNPATVKGGAVVVQGQNAVVFGDGEEVGEVTEGANAITAGATVNVYVVDEFIT